MEAVSVVSARKASVTVVTVADAASPSADDFSRLGAVLGAHFTDVETIIVANGVDQSVTRALADLVRQVPDVTIMFLPQRVDLNTARMVGMESALGDWVLVCTPTPQEIAALPSLLAELDGHDDILLGQGRAKAETGTLYRLLQRRFYRVYDRVNGTTLSMSPAALRLYTRAACLHLVNNFNGEILLKSDVVPGGYTTRIIPCDYDDGADRTRRLGDAGARGLRMFVSSSTIPLRLVNLLAIASAGAASLYSLYVIGIYLFKNETQPGWTTMSLQLSGMMFLFSLMFALLSEYVIQIHGASSPRRRLTVAREVRSPHTRLSGQLNIVDQDGAYRLGAPDDADLPGGSSLSRG